MSLSDILILTLLIMAFIVGFAGFYGGLAPSYSESNASITNFSSINKIKNITAKVYNISYTFQNASNSTDPIINAIVYFAPVRYIIGAVQAGLLVFDVPDMINTMITDILVNFIGIPQWIISVIETIILITVIFSIIFFIVGKK